MLWKSYIIVQCFLVLVFCELCINIDSENDPTSPALFVGTEYPEIMVETGTDVKTEDDPLITGIENEEKEESELRKEEGVEIERSKQEVESTNVICDRCECSNGLVDCRKRNLYSFFGTEDWNGLEKLGEINVDLSGNFMANISLISELPIRKLNLSNSCIHTVQDGSFKKLVNMTSLDLSRNRISSSYINKRVFLGRINDSKDYPRIFEHLTYLDLSYNELHYVSRDAFAFMMKLTYLDLSGNALAYIDEVTMAALNDLKDLEDFRLSNCELGILPEGLFRRHPSLARLDLSGNHFTTIPGVLAEAKNLVYLNLDNNPIEYINETTALNFLVKLQELSLSRLSKLRLIADGGLRGLRSLKILRMSGNPQLSELGPHFLYSADDTDKPIIKELYLNDNNIREINSHFLDRWDQLSNADYTNNPYVCDCRNQWMVDVLVPILAKMNSSSAELVCKEPKELLGLSFLHLHEMSKVLDCEESAATSREPDAAVMLGVFIGVFITFPMVFLIVVLWKRGYFARCRKTSDTKEYYDAVETDVF